jgi:DNA polymerase-4
MPFAEPVLHVDMDSFFVEVERLDDPALVGIPVAVGGTGGRGVVASASYEARAFGVRSAMPIGEARRRCPSLTVVSPEHGRYGEVSSSVFEIMRAFTPVVVGISIDEAFLDVSGLRLHYPSSQAIGAQIRTAIGREVGIPSSVGIAATKFVAKLASKHAKPDGLLRIPSGTELEFLHPLDVGELWGVGSATRQQLEDLGIRTIGDVAGAPLSLLESRLGAATARHLSDLSRATDPRPVEGGATARSISAENTFASDISEIDVIERETLRLCDQVAARLAKSRVGGHTVTLKVRFEDFATISRSSRSGTPIAHTADIWNVARLLLQRARIGGRLIRLLGVAVSDLVDVGDARQLILGAERRDAVAEAVDEVRERFGATAVIPARIAPATADREDKPSSDRQIGGGA